MVQSLGIDYKSNPYRWEVALTPKGVLVVLSAGDEQPADLSEEDMDVLFYLEQTETGSAELNAMGYELKHPNIKTIVQNLRKQGLVTIRFIHDMRSELR